MASRDRAFRLLLASSCLQVVAVFLSTGLTTSSPLYVAARIAYSPVCHQSAVRSFCIAGTYMPICARCTAIYLAIPMGLMLSALSSRGTLSRLRFSMLVRKAWAFVPDLQQLFRDDPNSPFRRLLFLLSRAWVLWICIIPAAIEYGFEKVGVPTTNFTRFLASLPLGAALGYLAGRALLCAEASASRSAGLQFESEHTEGSIS